MIRLTVELTPEQAAGLLRLVDKTGFVEIQATLYPHVSKDTRADQVRDVLAATSAIETALRETKVSVFPWIDCGRA